MTLAEGRDPARGPRSSTAATSTTARRHRFSCRRPAVAAQVRRPRSPAQPPVRQRELERPACAGGGTTLEVGERLQRRDRAGVARTTSHGSSRRRWTPVSCAATTGQAGSRSVRCRSAQRRQLVRPGSTSGPITAVVSRTPATRCATPPPCSTARSSVSTGSTDASTTRSGRRPGCGGPVRTSGATRRSASAAAVVRDRSTSAAATPAGATSPGRTVPLSATCT